MAANAIPWLTELTAEERRNGRDDYAEQAGVHGAGQVKI